MWRPERKALEAELVAEREAFLTGGYAERLSARGAAVPVWAWTNLLAHGSETDLRTTVDSHGGAGTEAWHTARARLAAELLSASRPERLLAEIQGAVLAAREGVERWDRRTWPATARAALRSNRPSAKS